MINYYDHRTGVVKLSPFIEMGLGQAEQHLTIITRVQVFVQLFWRQPGLSRGFVETFSKIGEGQMHR